MNGPTSAEGILNEATSGPGHGTEPDRFESVRIEVAKLELRPGDILWLKMPRETSLAMQDHVGKIARHLVGSRIAVVLADAEVEPVVIRKMAAQDER